ncbi:hypothetical protein TNCT_634061 [Trichonephila clavata]|uniref:Uncharacterized protein n=1 Tax=Trichonephila clavata TaxID=2740835 RepID=A0A8X6FM87_TRICU|nr:hypothetical protein TNCT_634061 [Trichonephila clavata]
MSMRKRGSLGKKTVNSKTVEHTRAAEAPDEKIARLQAYQVRHRAPETPEQYQEDQVHHRVARAAETPIQHVARLLGFIKQRNVALTLKWKVQMHDDFMYNPRYDYESNNLLDIGRMSNVFLKRSALKWKGETPSMCCSRGKVILPPILKPPELLCSLLKSENA